MSHYFVLISIISFDVKLSLLCIDFYCFSVFVSVKVWVVFSIVIKAMEGVVFYSYLPSQRQMQEFVE